jgi:hypothetical protein
MSLELEDKIMGILNLGHHYSWSNGSSSCQYIRRDAVKNIYAIMRKHGLEIDHDWLEHCKKAVSVDASVSVYRLTNTWIECSNAIRDAIERKNGGNGFKPVENWYFFDEKEREYWEQISRPVSDKRRTQF